jgi:hypothetical protein
VAAYVACRVAKLFHLSGRRFSAAGDEGEAVDVLSLIVLRLFEAFFCREQVVDVGLRVVVGGLCAPFAVFGASSRLGIDDRAHIELALCALYGNLVCSGIERFTVGGIRQPGSLVGRYVHTCQHLGFQFVDSHNMDKIGDSPYRILFPQRTVGYVLAQTAYRDAPAYTGKCGISFPAPTAEAYRLSVGLSLFHGSGISL